MKYFIKKEFEKSETAERLKIDNSIPDELMPGVEEFVEVILDPLREAWGGPIRVTSMYRCPALNKAVKGSSTSAHCYALAADLQPADPDRSQEEFNSFARSFLYYRPYDQIIDEHSGKSEWCHIGYKNRNGEQRKQKLIYKNGKYTIWN